MYINIKIDDDMCKNQDKCIKCVLICPAKVFVLKQTIEKKSAYAKGVKIRALFKDMCNGCMECVQICPEKCISIDFNKRLY